MVTKLTVQIIAIGTTFPFPTWFLVFSDPSHWCELEGNELCGTGKKQSPIDITVVKFDSDLGPFTFTGWDVNPNKEWDITNNGHSGGPSGDLSK